MAYAADGTWTPDNTDTATRVNDLTSKNSPLMQQARTQAKQASNQKGLLNSSMAVQAGEAAAYNAALPIASQDSTNAQASNVARQNYKQTSEISAQDNTQKSGLLNTELTSREKVASEANEMEIAKAELNVAANDREKASAAAVSMEQVYAEMFKSIAGNDKIPSAARNAYTEHIGKLRDSSLGLVEQMFDINLQWGTSNTTGGAPV